MLCRTLIMDEKGCTIYGFGKERYYTWEEFAIRRLEEHLIPVSRGYKKGYAVFFSVYPVEKAQKKNPIDYWRHHPLSMTMFSFHFALSEDEIYEPGYEESYFREKMKEWGVEAEKGEGIKEEEKQRQYDEMIELRRQQRKKIQSKGADYTNLKEYQQEVIKIRDFLQITMVILITVLLIWTGLSAEEGERIPILILEFLIDAPLLFFSSKVVTLSKEGCKISYLFFKKMYKWEELEIIREDYFPSFRDRRSRGIVFSKRKKNKAGYIYTTREIVGSGHILECFYIVLDADGNIHLYKRLAAKDGKTKLRKVAVNIPQKLAEWGVEMEKMMKYTGGTYDL